MEQYYDAYYDTFSETSESSSPSIHETKRSCERLFFAIRRKKRKVEEKEHIEEIVRQTLSDILKVVGKKWSWFEIVFIL